jgi:alkyl hydroperoxide reductase subunit F
MQYWVKGKKNIAIAPHLIVCLPQASQAAYFFNYTAHAGLMQQVTVYSTKNCPYCRMAKAFLDRNKVKYTSIDVGEDSEAAKRMVALSGQRGVPVITVDGEIIIGFDSQRLNELFGTSGPDVVYDVLILGAGPAGLTAGVYCARKMLNTLIISENIGGQALESWAIENYMGYRMVTGEDLMKKFEEQIRSLEIRLELDRAAAVTARDGMFEVKTASEVVYQAKSIILTQGKRPRKLDVLGEDRFIGRGISICSTCDGPLFRQKKVAVVGGGNSALQTAIEMSGIATSVILIVRSSIRADEAYTRVLAEKPNITTHLKSRITALYGDKFLTGVTVQDAQGNEQRIDLDGVFVDIGWIPNTEFLGGFVQLNDRKEIIVDQNCHTSKPGIFAAGDVTSVKSKQIIIAAGDGAKAALEAHEYIMLNT